MTKNIKLAEKPFEDDEDDVKEFKNFEITFIVVVEGDANGEEVIEVILLILLLFVAAMMISCNC